jgi:SOS-response transcriptional repressor LexA
MAQLSNRQKQIMDFIKAYRKDNQTNPTRKEIGRHIGTCFSVVDVHLKTMKAKGFIDIRPEVARSIIILKDDDQSDKQTAE